MKLLKPGLMLILFSTLTFTSYAQKNFKQEADLAFSKTECFEALELYRKAYAKEKNRAKKAEIIFGIAQSYHCLWEYKNAESWYRRAIKAGYPGAEAQLYLADAMKSQGKYEEAIVEYNNYKALNPGDRRGEDGAKSAELAKKWMDEPTRHVVNQESQLNSKQLDFAPTYADRRFNTLVFTSMREGSTGSKTDDITGQNFSDLYESKRDKNGKWSTPVIVAGEVNSEANEGAAYVNRRGNTMYFSRCGVDRNMILGCSIYKAKKVGAGWGNLEEINLAADTAVVAHPAVDPSEKFMVFTSDMEGGFGGKDLWISTYDRRGGWSKPVNLGPEINTPGDEMFPYIHNDSSLYFSSDAHLGMGGLDIFKAEMKGEGQWGNVSNLRYPINSPGDDFGIVFEGDADRGFFTSNRDGSMGGDDIYSFALPPLIFVLQGTVTDNKDKKPITGATVKLVGSDGSVATIQADATGFYKFDANGEDRYLNPNTTYTIIVEATDYLGSRGKESTVDLQESTTFVKDFALQSTKQEEIPFPEVQYALGSWELTENAKDSLNFLYQTLIDNPRIVIELSAHTDSRGSDRANQVLSEKRAKSCVEYLISRGIPADRMVPKGYGERRLLVKDAEIAKLKTKEEKEAAHQKNRRTVFSVLRTDYIPAGGLPEEPVPSEAKQPQGDSDDEDDSGE